jgi:hypothetical protein
MNYKVVPILAYIFCFSVLCHGQADHSTRYQELLAKASLAHLQKNYKQAIGLYEQTLTLENLQMMITNFIAS